MQCLARDPRQAPERFLAPISSICTTAGATTHAPGLRSDAHILIGNRTREPLKCLPQSDGSALFEALGRSVGS